MRPSVLRPSRPGVRDALPSTGLSPIWRQPTPVTTYIRCLHLLDLDLLEDCPTISQQTFSPKSSLKKRVAATEWSLFRLLELFDAADAASKLRPFFPPQTPLQSINLRAALFRSLSELKKNGVLPKDTLLRRTMLDECNGDKFEATLATFAVIVLNKVKSRRAGIAQNANDDQVLPLIIAHHEVIQKRLQERRDFNRRAQQYAQWLRQQQARLKVRQAAMPQETLQEKNDTSSLQEVVGNAWIGDDRWVDVLTKGDHRLSKAKDKTRSFDTSWETFQPTPHALEPESRTLLINLTGRIKEQKEVQRKWKAFRDSLQDARSARDQRSQTGQDVQSSNSIKPRFQEHSDLHLHQHRFRQANDTEGEVDPFTATHWDLVHAMNSELIDMKGSTSAKAAGGLKHEDLLDSTSGMQSMAAAPDGGTTSHRQPQGTITKDTPMNSVQVAKLAVPVASSAGSTQISVRQASQAPKAVPEESRLAASISSSDAGSETESLSPVNLTTPEPFSGPRQLNLLERTQMSMAALNLGSSPAQTSGSIPSSYSPRRGPVTSAPSPSKSDTVSTLHERTRQSLSLLPSSKPQSSPNGRQTRSTAKKAASAAPTRSSLLFPVNQFETPRKEVNAAHQRADSSPASSDSTTPRDSLFREDAEYTSVFKSRPMVALSPPLSPVKTSGLGFDTDDLPS